MSTNIVKQKWAGRINIIGTSAAYKFLGSTIGKTKYKFSTSPIKLSTALGYYGAGVTIETSFSSAGSSGNATIGFFGWDTTGDSPSTNDVADFAITISRTSGTKKHKHLPVYASAPYWWVGHAHTSSSTKINKVWVHYRPFRDVTS